MDEILRQIFGVARSMWQRRWLGLAVAWVCALAGAVAVLRFPEKYEANSRIFVDTQSVLKPLLNGLAVQPDVNQQIEMLARTLITRPNLEKLIRSADLTITVKSDRERDELIDYLAREIKLGVGGRENLYNVSYRDTDKQRARRVVESLTTMFVDSGLGGKRRDIEQAKRVLEEQIKGYEKKLEEAENRLKEFKLNNLNFSTGAGRDFFTQMQTVKDELDKTRLELRAAEQSRDALKRELAGEDPSLLTDFVPPPTIGVPEVDARIDATKKQLDELLRRYTEEHPDVIAARRLLVTLEEERKQQIDARRKAAAAAAVTKGSGGATNPVFQRIKIALAEAEATVASLRGRAGELEGRLGQLKASANRVPQIEADLAQLNRDYEIQKRQYDQLVSRRESASLAEDVDATTQLADFRIIDPPRVSPKPVFPNRAALASLALIAALGIGAFASFAWAQVSPTVDSAHALRQLTQRPVLGIVSFRNGPEGIRRARMQNVAFGGALSALVLLFGAWIAWIGLIVRT